MLPMGKNDDRVQENIAGISIFKKIPVKHVLINPLKYMFKYVVITNSKIVRAKLQENVGQKQIIYTNV